MLRCLGSGGGAHGAAHGEGSGAFGASAGAEAHFNATLSPEEQKRSLMLTAHLDPSVVRQLEAGETAAPAAADATRAQYLVSTADQKRKLARG